MAQIGTRKVLFRHLIHRVGRPNPRTHFRIRTTARAYSPNAASPNITATIASASSSAASTRYSARA